MSYQQQLAWSLHKLAAINGMALDSVRVNSMLQQLTDNPVSLQKIKQLCSQVGFGQASVVKSQDLSLPPFLVYTPDFGWGVIQQNSENNNVVFEHAKGVERLYGYYLPSMFIVRVKRPVTTNFNGQRQFEQLANKVFSDYRFILVEAIIATAFINVLNLGASLFSMQVYDRVIPSQSSSTLYVLAVGVGLVILFELILKIARAKIIDTVSAVMDAKLAKAIFQHLLSISIEQMPGTVGSLAGQIRGYEQVRSFYTSSSFFAWVDVPMAFLFVIVMMLIGTPLIAGIPLIAAILSGIAGIIIRKRINQLTSLGAEASNKKTGLLVEVVEGVETIKAGSGGWKFLSKWLQVHGNSINNDLQIRHSSESLAYFNNAVQQFTYSLIIVFGSIAVMDKEMTTGALIACSILSGRVLAPVLSIPSLLVQQGHAKAATEGLNKLFSLRTDYSDISRPLAPSLLRGQYELKDVKFAYGHNPIAIAVNNLTIRAGERVGILGSIGAGKSTLLRLLSGLYKPNQGRILLDGLDLSHIDRNILNQHIGYLQQDHRLFHGTLRDNLLIGLSDPGDQKIFDALKRTGLIQLVSEHPHGLDLQIQEGGKGLSGGQKQLVAFTRILLCEPSIILLDEPTASMDDAQERRCLEVLMQELADHSKTLIVATHKASLLPIIDRLIIISGHQVILDGPRDEVIAQLVQNKNTKPA